MRKIKKKSSSLKEEVVPREEPELNQNFQYPRMDNTAFVQDVNQWYVGGDRKRRNWLPIRPSRSMTSVASMTINFPDGYKSYH